MKIYFAEVTPTNIPPYIAVNVERFLVSYYFQRDLPIIEKILELCPKANIFFDSGAFSAMTTKTEININDYIDFCKTIESKVTMIASLDDILNPETTKQNYDKMTNAGLNVIPTYHIYEPYSYLDYYIKKADYIAIGGLVGNSKTPNFSKHYQKRKRINAILDVLNRIPKGKKIHLFGTTDLDILRRVCGQITSCDSTTADARSIYNRLPSVSGGLKTVKTTGSNPIKADERIDLWKYAIYKWLKVEEELNEYEETEWQMT